MNKMTSYCRLKLTVLLTSIAVEAIALTELTQGSNSYTVSDKCSKAAVATDGDDKALKTRCLELTEQLEAYKQEKINSRLELYESTIRTSTEMSNTSLATPLETTLKVFSKDCQDSSCPPMKITVPTGESAILYCKMPTGTSGNFASTWFHNNVELLTFDNELISTQRDIHLEYDIANGVNNLILRSITVQDAGNYTCYIDQRQRSTITVDVLAPGKIIQIEPMNTRTLGSKDPNARYFKESRDVVLFCIADGKPSPTVTWHRTNLQKELNDTRFKDCGQGVARIWNVKVEDTGDYVCTAANHLNDAEGDRQIVKLIIKYKPRIKPSRQLYRSGIGRYVCMACCIDAFPVPDAVTWFQNTTVLSNRQPGISITGDDKRTRLCISKIEAKHYGNFTCRVTNDVGYTDANIVLTGTPTTPTIVSSVISSWPTRYLLRWKASKRVEESHRNIIPINGFIIKYQYVWQTGEGQQVIKYISKDAIPTKSSVYEYYIENLHPDWSYKATVTSTNDFGESDESTPIYFITTELLVEETSKETSLTPEKRICPQVGNMASALPSSRANVRSMSQLLFTFCLLSFTLTFGT